MVQEAPQELVAERAYCRAVCSPENVESKARSSEQTTLAAENANAAAVVRDWPMEWFFFGEALREVVRR